MAKPGQPMNNRDLSPFTPGSPVPVDLFVGREDKIKEIIRCIKRTSSGKQENIFLSGNRGIGKSSLASFIRHYAGMKENFIGIHVFVGRVSTLEEMVRNIFDRLLKETKGETWFEQISKFFGSYIKEIGLFGVSVAFNPPERDLKKLVDNFAEALSNVIKKIEGEKTGLLIILDDINGLVESPEFANWYKSFADDVATHYRSFPVLLMLAGLPEKRATLAKHQPSLMRIFKVIEIGKLSYDDTYQFFSRAFEKAGVKVERNEMELMVNNSSGLPSLMQEIGDAVLRIDKDGVISFRDTVDGTFAAAEEVGKKYLDPKVYNSIRSKRYRSTLRKLGKLMTGKEVGAVGWHKFNKGELFTKLDENEKRVFNNFLRKMVSLGVIERDIEEGMGFYKFTNEIYPVYIGLESLSPDSS
ncbi:MAG: BREX system ATP-binding domain-containing protein [bacterium]